MDSSNQVENRRVSAARCSLLFTQATIRPDPRPSYAYGLNLDESRTTRGGRHKFSRARGFAVAKATANVI